MSKTIIAGIQQMGIGIPNVYQAWAWYRQNFAMNIKIFEEAAQANLMLPYTGNTPQTRHAVLALNAQGGGGFEIWQYTSRTPQPPIFIPQLGDLGIYICKIKTQNVEKTYQQLQANNAKILGNISLNPANQKHFFVKDPYNNIFEIVESSDFFYRNNNITAGPNGAVIGVSNIEQSLKVYADLLGYDQVIFDQTDAFEDFKPLKNGSQRFRRVLLTHKNDRQGAFSQMLGKTYIELIEATNYNPKKIFENRYWGDLGFIHLCFDVHNIAQLKKECTQMGFPFTVDSSTTHQKTFDMGEAAGHFAYIEDPDGTLIEFVETHKIPIFKKIGWYLDLRKRDASKPLPRLMLRALALNTVK